MCFYNVPADGTFKSAFQPKPDEKLEITEMPALDQSSKNDSGISLPTD